MKGKKAILVTGGAGFVGSNLALAFKKKYPAYSVLALDNLKRRGSELNLKRLKQGGVDFLHGDVRCPEDLEGFRGISTLIECSAEPSVMAGIDSNPTALIQHNLLGTASCLNLARRVKADFIFLSTSRVYPIKRLESLQFGETPGRFVLRQKIAVQGVSALGIGEKFSLEGPRSFYGASKLASELLIQEYNEFYGLKTVINRCGVIAGPWQMGKVDQGFVTLWAARHFWKKPLAYIGYGGTGKQVRDVLHIDDLFRLVDIQVHDMKRVNAQTFNVGGGLKGSVSLLELTDLCQKVLGRKISIASEKKTRPADVRWYVTDNSKVKRITGWQPHKSIDEVVADVAAWIRANAKDLEPILT